MNSTPEDSLSSLPDSLSKLQALFNSLYGRATEAEEKRDSLAIVINLLRPHAKDMSVCVPGKGTQTFGDLVDQTGYQQILKSRDDRIRIQILQQIRSDLDSTIALIQVLTDRIKVLEAQAESMRSWVKTYCNSPPGCPEPPPFPGDER